MAAVIFKSLAGASCRGLVLARMTCAKSDHSRRRPRKPQPFLDKHHLQCPEYCLHPCNCGVDLQRILRTTVRIIKHLGQLLPISTVSTGVN